MRTGKQIFEELILANLDRNVTVRGVVSSTETSITFTVCGTKWMQAGQTFFKGDVEWGIVSVDIEAQTVTATLPENETINAHDVLTIQAPTFLSGTPRNLNGENKLRERANVALLDPIVWLHESIQGEEGTILDAFGLAFDFTFYCLSRYDAADMLNNDRHEHCIYPMTQLRHAILQAIDTGYEIKRTGASPFTEFSRFGRENETGFTQYILDLNLSGVECRISVEVDKDSCNC